MDDLDLAMDPLSVGRLGYASADPVNLTDEDGHFVDYCQGVCSHANGQSYQSHGYASPGGVRVHTVSGYKYDSQYQAFTTYACLAACQAAATLRRWRLAEQERKNRVYAMRRARYQKSCSASPQKSHCAKYRKQHHIKTVPKPTCNAWCRSINAMSTISTYAANMFDAAEHKTASAVNGVSTATTFASGYQTGTQHFISHKSSCGVVTGTYSASANAACAIYINRYIKGWHLAGHWAASLGAGSGFAANKCGSWAASAYLQYHDAVGPQ